MPAKQGYEPRVGDVLTRPGRVNGFVKRVRIVAIHRGLVWCEETIESAERRVTNMETVRMHEFMREQAHWKLKRGGS